MSASVAFPKCEEASTPGSPASAYNKPAGATQFTNPEIRHVESLDGIRGIAILMVMATHGAWLSVGWAGVDLFFVLSGFLITGILRRARTDPFYWRRFYIKRATRILPAMLLGIVVAAILWPGSSRVGIVGYVLSLGDLVDVTRFSIFPIRHLWSLSVEEHYYLLWPLAVLKLPKGTLKKLLLGIILAEVFSRLVFTYLVPGRDPYAIYFLTPFRLDGIALGSLLALLMEEDRWQESLKKWSGIGAVLACALYLSLWKILGSSHFYPSAFNPVFNSAGYLLVAIIAFFVIAYAFLRPEALPTRVLRIRPLAGIGVISYGLYIYSWILLVLIRRINPSLTWRQAGLIHIAIAIPLSAVIFKYYERPITAWGRRMAAQLPARGSGAHAPPSEQTCRARDVETREQAEILGA
jgi:peptidoglycan/LPS O-acetylase OafA/YrhL